MTRQAVPIRMALGEAFLRLRRTPNCPPNNTAAINTTVVIQESSREPLTNRPISPEMELTKIKKAVKAAIFIGFPQFK